MEIEGRNELFKAAEPGLLPVGGFLLYARLDETI
jgi:hypothetical protein